MNSQRLRPTSIILCLILAIGLTGCIHNPKKQYKYSDEVEYLYPKGVSQSQSNANGITVAKLPLSMGIAFVPDKSPRGPDSALLEQQKMRLLNEIKTALLNDSMIGKVELVPSSYLSSNGSFNNLEQIRNVFGVDNVFLFSFEQAQYTDQGVLSLGYWTIIGAYFVPGEKSDTHSMINAVAYDITQRRMLFRNHGVSQSKELSTPVNFSQEIREERIHGFELAAEDFLNNLPVSLAAFKQQLNQAYPAMDVVTHPESHNDGFWGGD